MNCILCGFGEVGQAIYELFTDFHDIQITDISKDMYIENPDKEIDLLLIAFPYSDTFVDAVNCYRNMYKPKATIIFSTVAIGTTRQIEDAVHCPIEGKHPNIVEYLKKWNWSIGGDNETAIKFFEESKVKFKVRLKPETTEACKLLSTSYYGICIEFTRLMNEICNRYAIDYIDMMLYNSNYNIVYSKSKEFNFIRPILIPPEGNIGGHCVVPNAKLLDEQFPSVLLKEIYRDKEGVK